MARGLFHKVLVSLVAAFACLPAAAHHGPEEMIALISKRIEEEGATPVLLYKRATEYRILGQFEEAITDLNEALELKGDFFRSQENVVRGIPPEEGFCSSDRSGHDWNQNIDRTRAGSVPHDADASALGAGKIRTGAEIV